MSRSWWLHTFAVAGSIALVLASPVGSRTAPPAPGPEAIERLVRQLGSDSFAEREAATRALDALGEPALAALRRAAASRDLEVRRRAEMLIQTIEDRLYGEVRRFRAAATGGINSVAFSPDGKRILSGSHDHSLCVWDAATGKPLRWYLGHTNSVRSVAFSPDGRWALSGSDDQTVRLWSLPK